MNYIPKNHDHKINPKVAEKIKIFTESGCISCRRGHEISKLLNEKPIIIGINIDMLEIKINRCQLGLFGCKNKIKAAKNVHFKLKKSILKSEKNGRINCVNTWILSEKFNLIKEEISSACENLGIKVSKCQLGAF